MTFVDLYGTELDRELGSADRTVLFTTARRKAAVNAAQLEFAQQTQCFTTQTTVSLVDTTQEYDLEATITDFGGIAAQGVSIKRTDSNGNVTYLEGDDLIETTVERLNVEEPGWRAASAATPRFVYLRRNGGALNLGLYPAPSIPSGDTWVLLLPYWIIPADLSADADEPFTVSSNPLKSLRPYHRALTHFAAFDLEKFRKDLARASAQLQLFQQYVDRYRMSLAPLRGTRIRLARSYRQRDTVPRRFDPRVWP